MGWDYPVSSGSSRDTLITRTVLAAPAATISFSSITSIYENLVLELLLAGDDAINKADRVLFQFNGDTAANYDDSNAFGNAGAAGSQNDQAQTAGSLGYMSTAAISGVGAGWLRVTIPGYVRTVFRKYAVVYNGATFNSDGTSPAIGAVGGAVWRSTAAITSITLLGHTSAHFVTGTVASLFGQT